MHRETDTAVASPSREEIARQAIENPLQVQRWINDSSLYEFLRYFWPEVSTQQFRPNWHIEHICGELEQIAYRVGSRVIRPYDLIINVPPGTTKTIMCSIMFPAWCWTKWYWMRFICASYSIALSLESAEYCRDLIRSDMFREIYPELDIRDDKDTKSNFRIVRLEPPSYPGGRTRTVNGGNRYSTSVGGTLTGFHADIFIWDDPLNPNESASERELITTNRWIDETLPTRKTDKAISTVIGIMQRLHQDDPTGHILAKNKENVRHICLPGELDGYEQHVKPAELKEKYIDGLLDPGRLGKAILRDLEADLGQYGYAGQIGQNPTPPGGGMFKVGHFIPVASMPTPGSITQSVRYWDKAGTESFYSAYTVGVKMHLLRNGMWLIEDVRRGRWSAEERESIIQETARADGGNVRIFIEQEPGSGGKESAQGTVRNLAGWACYVDKPVGKKSARADQYSVQVNNGNFQLLRGDWNRDFIEEHRFFPFSKYMDQVDAAAGAFNQMTAKRTVRRLI